ncbi:hypothetical protein F4808DRAFT_220459 [Astrocystis sublimbata]|nr:hypothetical protein F4808DRAFT_220459 [Astrocystis sublimbata]
MHRHVVTHGPQSFNYSIAYSNKCTVSPSLATVGYTMPLCWNFGSDSADGDKLEYARAIHISPILDRCQPTEQTIEARSRPEEVLLARPNISPRKICQEPDRASHPPRPPLPTPNLPRLALVVMQGPKLALQLTNDRYNRLSLASWSALHLYLASALVPFFFACNPSCARDGPLSLADSRWRATGPLPQADDARLTIRSPGYESRGTMRTRTFSPSRPHARHGRVSTGVCVKVGTVRYAMYSVKRPVA